MSQLKILLLAIALLAGSQAVTAQESWPELTGTWEGSMMIGPNSFNLAFTLRLENGQYSAAFTSSDMRVYGMPADSVTLNNNKLLIKVLPLDGEYTGTLRLAENGVAVTSIDGDWFQEGEMIPLKLLPVEKPTL